MNTLQPALRDKSSISLLLLYRKFIFVKKFLRVRNIREQNISVT